MYGERSSTLSSYGSRSGGSVLSNSGQVSRKPESNQDGLKSYSYNRIDGLFRPPEHRRHRYSISSSTRGSLGGRCNSMFLFLITVPVLCLMVILYEMSYLQSMDIGSDRIHDSKDILSDTNLNIRQTHHEEKNLLKDEDEINHLEDTIKRLRQPKIETGQCNDTSIHGRRTIILIANYRDSKRCAETLTSIFDNAVCPDLLTMSIYDQIYIHKGEKPCVDVYCEKVGTNCRKHQIYSTAVDAKYAKGPTVARYHTEDKIGNEDFCMAIDSHLTFVKDWDKEIMSQWDAVKNDNAIITIYPKSTTAMMTRGVNDFAQKMCYAQIESNESDAMIRFTAPISMKIPESPILQAQLAGGFNFGNCKQAKEIRNDPHTEYLFHGEEYSRASRLWTHGYDFYAPTKDIAFHWYEKRNVVWERDWNERYIKQQESRRRVRYCLGLPVSKMDFSMEDIDKFKLGTKRTFEQWEKFSGIRPRENFTDEERQFSSCEPLELVPLNDITNK